MIVRTKCNVTSASQTLWILAQYKALSANNCKTNNYCGILALDEPWNKSLTHHFRTSVLLHQKQRRKCQNAPWHKSAVESELPTSRDKIRRHRSPKQSGGQLVWDPVSAFLLLQHSSKRMISSALWRYNNSQNGPSTKTYKGGGVRIAITWGLFLFLRSTARICRWDLWQANQNIFV